MRETARALSQGRLDVVPMGYLIRGPVGTGKSFIVQCCAKEIGIPVVELLNFRSKWQGLPVDLKRQGRAEEHLALFPPATVAERVKVFDLLRQRLGVALEPGVDAAALFAESRDALSAADLEAILVRSSRRMASAGQKALSAALLRELIRDFQPPSYPLELEYQRLIAAFECTSRQLLPPDLAAVPPEAIGTRLTELRAALGKSA